MNPISKSSSSQTPHVSAHAQDFSGARTSANSDHSDAVVSINQAQQKKVHPLTSIGHVSDTALTSVAHAGRAKRSVFDDEYIDESRERARYAYIRKLVKEKHEQQKQGDHILPIKTGGQFRFSGKYGITRRLQSLRRQRPSSYRNLSEKDIEYFSKDVVEPHAKAVHTGVGFDWLAKRDMKRKLESDYRTGKISREDSRDLKGLVDQL
jgi:hypothetical protein